MDRIYYPTQKELGIFAARRLPRGSGGAAASGTPVPMGGVPAELNPTPIVLGAVVAATGQHTETERTSYIVPKGRRLLIQTAVARLFRVTNAGTSLEYGALAALQRSGNVTRQHFCYASASATPAGTTALDNHNGELECYEGDVISLRTFDANAAGTVRYEIHVIGVEHDAFFKAQGAVNGDQFQGVAGSSGSGGFKNLAVPYSGYNGYSGPTGGQG